MAEERRHPDLFSASEAATYLHLENAVTLDHLRREKLLTGFMIGKQMMYLKNDLDDCIAKLAGLPVTPRLPKMTPMRMAQS